MDMSLAEGDKAPAFALASDGGGKVSSGDLKDKPFVLYFYPKDDTSGCTKEAIAFTERLPDFKKLGVEVIGVSPDSPASHDKFKAKHGLGFALGADVDRAVCESYGVWVEKSMYGRKYMGVDRSTFLVGRDGRIARVWRKVKVPGHVDEVLAAARTL
jgi:peroxiredoxin Q/BCP